MTGDGGRTDRVSAGSAVPGRSVEAEAGGAGAAALALLLLLGTGHREVT